MISDSLIINKLDSIIKQLALIKSDTMSSDATDTIKTVALVASPFLVGFLLFLLNKNKEYKFKKSELCGEIYACLEELKMANGSWVASQITMLGFKRCDDLVFQSPDEYLESDKNIIKKSYDESVIKVDKDMLEVNIIMKNFLKCIGSYRFYLPHIKKKELDLLLEPFSIRWTLNYDFSTETNMQEVVSKMNSIILQYNKEQTPKDSRKYKAIESFIDDYELEISI